MDSFACGRCGGTLSGRRLIPLGLAVFSHPDSHEAFAPEAGYFVTLICTGEENQAGAVDSQKRRLLILGIGDKRNDQHESISQPERPSALGR